jgi:hypothetical protein
MGNDLFNSSISELTRKAKIRAGTLNPADEEKRRIAQLQALQSVGSLGSGSGGVIGGTMSGAGTGAAIGSAFAPGVGTAIGAGLGALVGGVGAGITGGKEDERERERMELEKRKMDLYEKGQKLDQFNTERKAGLEGLEFLADNRSKAIQRRNRSLFANDLMRVLG